MTSNTPATGPTAPRPVSLARIARAKCLDCRGGSHRDVRQCDDTRCPLYDFRFGTNPFHTRSMTAEQKQAAAQRLAKYRGGAVRKAMSTP